MVQTLYGRSMLPLRDENPTSRTAFVTWLILAVCVATFVVAQGGRGNVVEVTSDAGTYRIDEELRFNLRVAAVPCEIQLGRPLTVAEVTETYDGGNSTSCADDSSGPALFPDKLVSLSIFTSLFLHTSWIHLGFNMLFLWIFGNNIEDRIGHLPFAAFYLLSGLFATLGHVAAQPSSTIAVLGASGAVAGLMGAYLAWFPDAPIRTLVFLIVVDIRARWFLLGWFALQFFTTTGSSVAWVSHVVGFVFGFVMALGLKQLFTDPTGGVGRGPYPHPSDWIPHHEAES